MWRSVSTAGRVWLVLGGLVVSPAGAAAQVPTRFSDVAEVKVEIVPPQARPGQTVTYRLTVIPKAGAWTYPVQPPEGQSEKTTLVLPPPGELIFVREPADPPGYKWKRKPDPNDLLKEIVYTPEPITWELPAVVSPRAAPGRKRIVLDKLTTLTGCNDFGCVNSSPDGSDLPAAELEVLAGPAVAVEEAYRAAVDKALGKPDGVAGPATPVSPTPSGPRGTSDYGSGPKPAANQGRRPYKSVEQYEAELQTLRGRLETDGAATAAAARAAGIGAFLLTAAMWGFLTLLTPCVFPMIPITVSIFLKQADHAPGRTLLLAGVYCLTIIVVLSTAAFFLLSTFVELSTDPWMNLGLCLLFIVFALSLFGMYEVTLSTVLVLGVAMAALVVRPRLVESYGSLHGNLTVVAALGGLAVLYGLARRHIGQSAVLRYLQQKQSGGGIIGTVFGAIAFTLVGFTCVAPFLGGFAGMTAAGAFSRGELLAGALAFAGAFAAPFFLLALFPSLLRQLPRSGGWMDTIKVVMGFLELAAALKFLRTAELRWLPEPAYCTYDLVLGAWVAISVACGLYLLGLWRLQQEEEPGGVGVVRMLFGVAFLSLAVYLVPALFRDAEGRPHRPGGAVFAWIDAFLLPEPGREGDLQWHYDLPDAVQRLATAARQSGRPQPLFLDFTGVTCTNCKYNEFQVFPQPRLRELLGRYERVQLYTDEVPAALYDADPGPLHRVREARLHRQLKIDLFGNDQLPLYAVLHVLPDGRIRIWGTYDEGKINEPERFAAFLQDGLAAAQR